MKKIISVLYLFLMIINLCSCGTSVKKILSDNGYSSFEIEEILSLPYGVDGLDSNGHDNLVLLSYNGRYGYAFVNTESQTIIDSTFGYTPLNVVQELIWNSDRNTNVAAIRIYEKYIKAHGINCLTEKTYAEDYLRELTNTNGVISTADAQNAIRNSATMIFSKIDSNDDVVIFFEDDSAVPKFYATQSSMMVYNWSFPTESDYSAWKEIAGYSSHASMEAVFGPPYVPKTVWAVVDSDFKEVGVYNTRKEMETYIKPRLAAKSTSSTSKKSTENISLNTDSNGYLFPSDKEALTKSDLAGMTQKEVAYVRNEIYARHGYIFNKDEYRDYFESKSWYKPNPNFNEGMFNNTEKANKDLIVAYETEKGWR